MLRGRQFVVQQVGRAGVGDEQQVEFAVVVEIACCHTPADKKLRQSRSRLRGHVGKCAVVPVRKKLRGLQNVLRGQAALGHVVGMPVADYNVFPAVVVEIAEQCAEGDIRACLAAVCPPAGPHRQTSLVQSHGAGRRPDTKSCR